MSLVCFYRSSSMRTTTKPSKTQHSGWLAWYEGNLKGRPLTTKGISSAICLALGNIIAQMAAEVFDLGTILFMYVWGLVIVGPLGHWWYAWLDRVVRSKGPSSTVMKILLDQVGVLCCVRMQSDAERYSYAMTRWCLICDVVLLRHTM